MTVIFNDTFTDTTGTDLADHTPDTGTSWTNLIAQLVGDETMTINGIDNTAQCGEGGLNDGVLYTADCTYLSANYKVEVDSTTTDTGDDYSIIFARIQDSNNMYALEWTTTTFILYSKTTVGGWSALDTATSPTVAGDDVIKLEVDGTSIKGYINNVEKVSATNSDHTAAGKGGIGVGSIVNSGADMSAQEFDNFTITDLGAAAGTNTQINIGDTWKEISAVKINIGDVWKDVAGAQINIGDAWKEIF